MNNEELKKKIAQIIAEYCCPYGKTHKQLYGDDRMCYSKMNFAECNSITECTDALIKAGIGDVSSEKAMRELAEAFHREKCAEYDLLNYQMQKSEYRVVEAEHRADVAEKALKHAVNVYIAHTETSSKKKWWYKYFLREAEKELAEERKNYD